MVEGRQQPREGRIGGHHSRGLRGADDRPGRWLTHFVTPNRRPGPSPPFTFGDQLMINGNDPVP
jgi:hypothetical protein